jgi:hypothetical protein
MIATAVEDCARQKIFKLAIRSLLHIQAGGKGEDGGVT